MLGRHVLLREAAQGGEQGVTQYRAQQGGLGTGLATMHRCHSSQVGLRDDLDGTAVGVEADDDVVLAEPVQGGQHVLDHRERGRGGGDVPVPLREQPRQRCRGAVVVLVTVGVPLLCGAVTEYTAAPSALCSGTAGSSIAPSTDRATPIDNPPTSSRDRTSRSRRRWVGP